LELEQGIKKQKLKQCNANECCKETIEGGKQYLKPECGLVEPFFKN
jgi:hypothetical protein